MPFDANIPRLLDLLFNQVWLIDPAVYETWLKVASTKLAEGTVDIGAYIEPKESRDDAARLERHGPVAVVPVRGELTKRPTFFSSGMTYNQVRRYTQAALDDPSVGAILLNIDSPGGVADGLTPLAEFLEGAAKQKPLYAFAEGQATSAAYWIASTAKEIAAYAEANLGSIGTRSEHQDWSRYYEKIGLKVTHITSGAYKASGAADQPLSDRDREYFQSLINQITELFVGAVAQNRGMNREDILGMEARVYLAAEAKELGLIDHVMSLDKFINHIKGSLQMDLNELKAQHPGLVEEIRAEATKGMIAPDEHEKALAEARAAGAEAARQRAAAIMDCEEAEGRRELARHFALETEMEPEAANKALAKSPAAQPEAKSDPLSKAMSTVRDPETGPNDSNDDQGASGRQAALSSMDKLLEQRYGKEG